MLVALATFGHCLSAVNNLAVGQAASCSDPNGMLFVHRNIPGPEEEWPKVTLRRVRVTLGRPNFLLHGQYGSDALLIIRQRSTKVSESRNESTRSTPLGEGWTVTHGFFVLMGGFMEYDSNEPVGPLLPHELEGYSLTGRGDFPWITKEEIEDESKGDLILKVLVLLQTGWFIARCIARGVQGLPVTELELVTIAFAVLNFAMYGFGPKEEGPSEAMPPGKKEFGFRNLFWRSLSALPSAIVSGPVIEDYEASPWSFHVVSWPFSMAAKLSGGGSDALIVDKRVVTFYQLIEWPTGS